jgi:hypothetical protein
MLRYSGDGWYFKIKYNKTPFAKWHLDKLEKRRIDNIILKTLMGDVTSNHVTRIRKGIGSTGCFNHKESRKIKREAR